MRLIEIISDLGLEFLGLTQKLDLQQAAFLRRRLQIARQAASPTFRRSITTHRTTLDYSGWPARLGNIKSLAPLARAWLEKRRQQKGRKIGIETVDIHVVTFEDDGDIAHHVRFLNQHGYRMTTLFELLCFVSSNPTIVGRNDALVSLGEAFPGKKRLGAPTNAHCISRSPKNEIVYRSRPLQSLLREHTEGEPHPLLHFVVMDAEDGNRTELPSAS
jgi:hypothetical protein